MGSLEPFKVKHNQQLHLHALQHFQQEGQHMNGNGTQTCNLLDAASAADKCECKQQVAAITCIL
jgi:hypothetical protein